MRLIEQGALNEAPVESLAARLGIGERYLRKLFQREIGVSPTSLALNQRLLFAKQLLAETQLPLTQIAYAAGFGSVRRFNSAVKTHFKLPPRALRKQPGSRSKSNTIRLQLQYRPPYDWGSTLSFFARHGIPGLESIEGSRYRRNISLNGHTGWFQLEPQLKRDSLLLELHLPDQSLLMPAVTNIRRMFDLNANPYAIHDVLAQDNVLAPLLRRNPGVRVLGHWSLYEAGIRGIVGQQVSTKAARSILARLADFTSSDKQCIAFPTAEALLGLDDSHFPMPSRRRETLRAFCTLYAQEPSDLTVDAVAALKGIGPWTCAMMAMRGQGHPDVFPNKDLGLINAWAEQANAEQLNLNRIEQWRPWRSYAANLLWRSLSE